MKKQHPSSTQNVWAHPLLLKMADEIMKKRLEFRKMLLKVSDRLSSENLKNLKHLLSSEVPKAKLESAAQGIDIFEILEERSKLSLVLLITKQRTVLLERGFSVLITFLAFS